MLLLCSGARTAEKMYTQITGSSCFRRLNATHTTGCSSTFRGSVGVLHIVESKSDFDFIVNKPPAPPYAVVVPPTLFTRENILYLRDKAPENIAAIVLVNNSTNLRDFSQESKCPNQYGGLLAGQTCDVNKVETAWNPFGTGLLHENFPFPIHFIKDENDIKEIHDCYAKFNSFDIPSQHQRSLCSLEIKSFMSAAVSSDVCIRRNNYLNNVNPTRYCDPLQGKNVFATLFPREVIDTTETTLTATSEPEKFIIVSARIDTTSMFDGLGIGAMDSAVPFVTLISTAHTLAKILPQRTSTSQLNVLFMLFNGESYDYIGSQRFVYDMEKGVFPPKVTATRPLNLTNIELLIDIASLDDLNSISLYQYNESKTATKLQMYIEKYNAEKHLNIKFTPKISQSLPPASAQSFLRDNSTLPAVIFYSDFNKNKFYHSVYDDTNNINFTYQNTSGDFTTLTKLSSNDNFPLDSVQVKIRNLSSALAYALYEIITGNLVSTDLGANPILVDELLFCYLESSDCPLFKASSKPNTTVIHPVPPQRYISVQGSPAYETIAWTYRVFGFLVGQVVQKNQRDCVELPLAWFAGYHTNGECRRTTQNVSDAYSPAFTIDDYDWSSNRYSSWTESTWRELKARIFLKPSLYHEALTLAIGFVVLIISFVLVFLLNSKSDILFGDSTSSVGALTIPAQC